MASIEGFTFSQYREDENGFGGILCHQAVPTASYCYNNGTPPTVELLGNAKGEKALRECIAILHAAFPKHVVDPDESMVGCLRDLCFFLRDYIRMEHLFNQLVAERGGCWIGAIVLLDSRRRMLESLWMPPRISDFHEAEIETIAYVQSMIENYAVCECIGYQIFDLLEPFPAVTARQFVQIYRNGRKVSTAVKNAKAGFVA